uniref:RHS repeat-associated core domain-containing protein n=1 Tax=Dyella sp. ASV21 TaxID=2795114 RepID=UPI0018EA3B43
IYDFVSKHVGNSESVTVARPLAGIYYLALVGESPGYANVSVQGSYTAPPDGAGASSQAEINYITADHLGTPRAITNQSSSVIWQWPYQGNPFGEQQPTSVTGYVFNLRFPGQYNDAESGLNYNVNRYYESAIGGYDQPDPTGLAAGPSLYAYVGGNPLSYVDPLGLQESTVDSYCARYGAAACVEAIGGRTGAGISAGTATAIGAGIATAVGVDSALRKQCDDDDQCGPDSRFEAYTKALAWAGMGIGDEGVPIPWSQYRGRGGANYTYVKQNGGSNYGYYDPGSKAKVMNHPDGHPDQLGDSHPEHHNCPHFHAVNARGEERIFPYKRGT